MGAPKKYHTEEERLAALRESNRRYKESNREKVRQSRKDFQERNRNDPEYRKRCAAYSRRSSAKLSVGEKRRRAKVYRARRSPIRDMLSDARKRSKYKGWLFDLTFEDLILPSVCPVLGIPLFRGDGGKIANSPSIDRIDNTKGYVKGNVAVISLRANALKNDASVEEMRQILRYMENPDAVVRDQKLWDGRETTSPPSDETMGTHSLELQEGQEPEGRA
jgi:hypothetical protein